MLNTIKLKCLYSEVTSVPDIKNIDAYKDMIKPLNYNFSLDKGAFYNSLGFKLFDNIAWSYLVQETPSFNELIAFAPIILFDFDWIKVPRNWLIRSDPDDKKIFEILPKVLADIPNWFEHYMDEDEEVIKVINKEISSMPQNNQLPKPEDPYAWPFEEYK